MKLPIVRRGSRENPVPPEEINALYQSWGSAGTTRCPCSPSPPVPRDKPALCPTANTPKLGSRLLAGSAALAQEPMQSTGHPTASTGQQQSPWPCHVFPLGSRGDGKQPPAPCAQECRGTACTEKFLLGCKISPSRAAARGGHGSLRPAIALLQRSTKQNSLKTPKSPKTHRHSSQPEQEALLRLSLPHFQRKKKLLFPSRAQELEGREVPPGQSEG